jgi:hypothetical protein
MTRNRFMLLILVTSLFLAGVVSALGARAESAPSPANLFTTRYAAYMPGKRQPVDGDCLWDLHFFTADDYCYYRPDEMTYITLTMRGGRIRVSRFYFRRNTVRLGDLAGWYGAWKAEGKYLIVFEDVRAFRRGPRLGIETVIAVVEFRDNQI